MDDEDLEAQLVHDPQHLKSYAPKAFIQEEMHALFGVTPRQSGKTFQPPGPGPQLGVARSGIKDRRTIFELLERMKHSSVVVWQSNGRYTYAAIHARGYWFITGAGVFYGKNEFTQDEFVRDVLCHDEVTAIWISTKMAEVYVPF